MKNLPGLGDVISTSNYTPHLFTCESTLLILNYKNLLLPLFPLTCMSHAQHEPYGRRKQFSTVIHKLDVCWVEVS